LVVPTSDGAALADAVLTLRRSSREVMGRRGYRYFKKHFDHEVLVDRLLTRLIAVAEIGDDRE